MRLLLTNDDGIFAPGINALARELSKYHDVVIIAPESQRSGFSHKISVDVPLRVEKVELEDLAVEAYRSDGSPADCARLGLHWLVGEKFDAVISGINQGSNIGTDILYSGTCGAAMEAAMKNVPALAVSLNCYRGGNFALAAKVAARVIESGILSDIPAGVCLNLNVPNVDDDDLKGVKWVRHGYNVLAELVRPTDEGCTFIGLAREGKQVEFLDDFTALDDGYATITPIDLDLNAMDELVRLGAKYTF